MHSMLDSVTAKRYLTIMNIFVLAVHACLFLLFMVLDVGMMALVNLGSMLCYGLCFLLVKKEKVMVFTLVTFAEITLHTLLAMLCVGSNAGFQLYFIDCIAIVLFSQYFSAHLGIKPVNGPALSAVCGVLYIFSLMLARERAPMYGISELAAYICTLFNSILTLMFSIFFFSLLTNAASGFEGVLAKQAMHDNLTGLVNRHYLTEYMNHIHETQNLENHWLAIIDIDDFKKINDRFGHLCGDYVLRSVAEIIRACCGERMVCRWGGEEFLVVGIDPSGGKDMNALLEEVRRTIDARVFAYDAHTKLHLTATIGAALYSSSQGLEEWVDVADTRLYKGKQNGKNQVVSIDA